MNNQTYNYEFIKRERELTIYYHYINPGVPYNPFQWHQEYEIIYCISGHVDVILKTATIHLAADSCYIIDTNVLHATRCSEDSSLIVLAIPPDFVSAHLPHMENFYFDLHYGTIDPFYIDALSQFRSLILEYKHVFDEHEDGWYLLANSIALRLLFLLNKYFKIPRPENTDHASAKKQQHLKAIIAYVYQNYRQPVSIQEAASLVHYQPQYFCRFFKKNTGKTFYNFCNEVRMYYAHQEIIHSRDSIQKIAEANGFQNYDTFRKLFMQQFGTTPSKFRRSHVLNRQAADNTHESEQWQPDQMVEGMVKDAESNNIV